MISALISVVGLALTASLAYLGAVKGTTAKIASLETELKLLSERVEKHNNVVEKVASLRTEMQDVQRRLDRLEADR